jgi:hypothetical protein
MALKNAKVAECAVGAIILSRTSVFSIEGKVEIICCDNG